MYEFNFLVRDGGLMSYSMDLDEAFGRVAALIDRILKGAKPADLPFEQPTRFNAQAMRTDAETLTLGDKSVWVPSTAMLWAVRGRRMLGLRMGPVGAPPAPTPALQGTAESIARKIIGKM